MSRQCTRVQWTPPLRESFGYPLILAQILSVSWCLRQTTPHWKHLCCIAFTTTASLVTWQFSQFVFLTQVLSLTVLWIKNSIPRTNITVVFLGKLVWIIFPHISLFLFKLIKIYFTDWSAKCNYFAFCQRNASNVFLLLLDCCIAGIHSILSSFLISSSKWMAKT
jgi:hypothetical protein